MSRARRDDAGAVAILVAILASTVLFAVGALTVDLGSLWVARAGLKGLAEAAALAGAARLPQDPRGDLDPTVEDDAVAAAVAVLCGTDNRRPQWDPSVCTGRIPAWTRDLDEDNGEVVVSRAEAGAFPAIDARETDVLPWVLRVVTPPTTVTFGLARAFGQDTGTARASAGARRGLPFPVDALQADAGFPGPSFAASPYYLTVDDLHDAQLSPDKAVCLRTAKIPAQPEAPLKNDIPPDATTTPQPFVIGGAQPTVIDPAAPTVTLVGVLLGEVLPPTAAGPIPGPYPFTVRFADNDRVVAGTVTGFAWDQAASAYTIDVTPPATVFGDAWVWIDFDDANAQTATGVRRVTGISTAVTVTLPPDPDPRLARLDGDCDSAPPSGRGLLAPLDPADAKAVPVTRSITDGLSVAAHPFGSFPVAQPVPTKDTDCDAVTPGAQFPAPALRPESAGVADPEVNCMLLRQGSDVRPSDQTAAWLGTQGPSAATGRLQQACSTQRSTIDGRSYDTTNLFSRSPALVRSGTDRRALRTRITTGQVANGTFRDVITTKAFRCPRFLLVPVLDTSRPPAEGRYPVVGLSYFWVSDTTDHDRPRPYRGLITTEDDRQVVGIRGWVVDPEYVQGGDWVADDSTLPMAVPEPSVLSRTPCDGHPDSTCSP